MSQMDTMMSQGGQMHVGASGTGGQGMMMTGMSNAGGGGGYSCQTMMVSSRMGPDGQMKSERYQSSTVGDGRTREVKQAYSNDHSGLDKMSLERQMDGRGRKMVKERCRQSG